MLISSLHLALAILASRERTVVSQVPEISIVQYEVELHDTEKKIQIRCKLPNVTCFGRFEVYDEKTLTTLASERCSDGYFERYGYADFYLKINDTNIFGHLRCRYIIATSSSNEATIPFAFCSDDSKACIESAGCDNDADPKFCIATESASTSCSTISDPSWCAFDKQYYRYCPVGELGICNAILKNYSAAWFQLVVLSYTNSPCPQGEQPLMSYKGKRLLFGEIVLADSSDREVRLKCPAGTDFVDMSILVHNFHPIVASRQDCKDEIVFTLLDYFFTEKAEVRTVRIAISHQLDHPKYMIVAFEFGMVVFGTDLSISASGDKIQCHFTASVSDKFRVTRWWTRKSTGHEPIGDKEVTKGFDTKPWNMTALQPDEYQCHVLLEYKTCSPHRYFKKEISKKVRGSANALQWALTGDSLVFWTILLLAIYKEREN